MANTRLLKPIVGTSEHEIILKEARRFFNGRDRVFLKEPILSNAEKLKKYGKKVENGLSIDDFFDCVLGLFEMYNWPKDWRAEKRLNAAIRLVLNDCE